MSTPENESEEEMRREEATESRRDAMRFLGGVAIAAASGAVGHNILNDGAEIIDNIDPAALKKAADLTGQDPVKLEEGIKAYLAFLHRGNKLHNKELEQVTGQEPPRKKIGGADSGTTALAAITPAVVTTGLLGVAGAAEITLRQR